MGKSFIYRDWEYKQVRGSSNYTGCSLVSFTSPDDSKNLVCNIYSSGVESFHESVKKVIDGHIKTSAYDLHCDFDLVKHKKTYIDYLEVIIMPTGKISYATPSHQSKLEELACKQLGVERQALLGLCPNRDTSGSLH